MQLAAGNRGALVHAIERAAVSCGKPGLALFGYPKEAGDLEELAGTIAAPRAVLSYDVPPSSGGAPTPPLFESELSKAYTALGVECKAVVVADMATPEAELAVVSKFQPSVILLVGCAGTGRGTLATSLANPSARKVAHSDDAHLPCFFPPHKNAQEKS